MTPSSSIVKITSPRLTAVTQRNRVFQLLDQCRSRPIIWLSGPGGSGKTTLTTSYLEARRLPCLWYQIDEGDTDLSTFFYYLGLAAKKAAPRHRKPLPLLTPEHLPNVSRFTRTFFLDLYARLKPPFAIVFDNYQDAAPASKLHAALNTAMSMLPEGITVFILSRGEPTPEYARLRANGDMNIIGWEELRFTRDETAYLIRNRRPQVTEEIIQRIYGTTEGWVAGLVLFLERIKKDVPVAEHIRSMGREAIFDYFAAELFNSADRDTQEFLLKTAFLPEMSPHMAGLLTGNPHAGTMLARLHRNNFFTTRITRHDAVYQYHQLFREYLLSRAEKTFKPEELSDIRYNAASLLESADRVEDAVQLFRAAEDWKEVERLICQHAPEFRRQGRTNVIHGWLEGLPSDMINKDPHLLYWRGVCLAPVNPVDSHRDLIKAVELFRAQKERAWMFRAWAEVADSTLLQVEFGFMNKWYRVLRETLQENPEFPDKEIEMRVTMSMFNSLAVSQPDHPEISGLSQRALDLIEKETGLEINVRLMAAVHLNIYYVWTGNLAKAGRIDDLFAKYSSDPAVTSLTLLYVKSANCLYNLFIARHEVCLKRMDEGLKEAEKSGIYLRSDHLLCHGISSALSAGDMKTADELLGRLGATISRAKRFEQAYFYFLIAWQAMYAEDTARAYEYQDKALQIIVQTRHLAAISVLHFQMADILSHLRRAEEAEAELSKGFEIARRMKSANLEFMGSLIEAGIAFGRNEETRGIEALRRAMAQGREQGFVNMYWWRPSLIAPLSVKALEAGIEVEYVQGLIQKRKLIPEVPPIELDNWPWMIRVHTLGRFAIAVNGKPLVFPGRMPHKALAMLKMIIAAGERGASAEEITDSLWPDAEGDLAATSFDTTLHRLRKLIAHDEAICFQNGILSLDARYCWVDARAFERIAEKADAASKKWGTSGVEALRHMEKAMDLYHGPFLSDDAAEPWTLSAREQLRNKYFDILIHSARLMMQAGKDEQAIERLRKGLDADDLSEELYQQLMLCYQKRGQQAEVVKVYRRCRAMLEREFGLEPSEKTEEIYRIIKTK